MIAIRNNMICVASVGMTFFSARPLASKTLLQHEISLKINPHHIPPHLSNINRAHCPNVQEQTHNNDQRRNTLPNQWTSHQVYGQYLTLVCYTESYSQNCHLRTCVQCHACINTVHACRLHSSKLFWDTGCDWALQICAQLLFALVFAARIRADNNPNTHKPIYWPIY